MNGKGVLLVIVAVLSLYQMVLGDQLDHPIKKRNFGLTTAQKTCIQTQLALTNSDAACTTVRIELENAYNADDVAAAIGMNTNLFSTFCQPSCGQALVNAWGECNIYDTIRNVAELLIDMCSANGQRKCYQDYTPLVAVFEDGATCSADLGSGSCSDSCRTSITQDVGNYGCCINAAIKYADTVDTADVNADADTLFTECRVIRPSVCPAPASALGPPGTTIPGSGAGQPVAIVAFVLLNSLVAFIMHF